MVIITEMESGSQVQILDELVCMFVNAIRKGMNPSVLYHLWSCSSHRSISFRESMPLLREPVTHWPINWQSALIPSPSQELFFYSLLVERTKSESPEPAAETHLSHTTATNSTWNPSLAASFAHASYKPRTYILTSDTRFC